MIKYFLLCRRVMVCGKHLLTTLLLVILLAIPGSTIHSHTPSNHHKLQQKETVVYITRTGQKYHRAGCRYLSQSQIKTTKDQAIKNRYGACKVCKP